MEIDATSTENIAKAEEFKTEANDYFKSKSLYPTCSGTSVRPILFCFSSQIKRIQTLTTSNTPTLLT